VRFPPTLFGAQSTASVSECPPVRAEGQWRRECGSLRVRTALPTWHALAAWRTVRTAACVCARRAGLLQLT
jgi:hypothetical protein